MADAAAGEEIVATDLVLNEPKKNRHDPVDAAPSIASLPLMHRAAHMSHPGVELRANLKLISHRCHFFEVAFVWVLTKETIDLPLGCLQGGWMCWSWFVST